MKEEPAVRPLALALGVAYGQGRRDHMEDRHTLIPSFLEGATAADGVPRAFMAVYDGHSSARGSEHASRRLHEFIAAEAAVRMAQGRNGNDLAAQQESAAITAALKSAFEDVDEEIIQHALQRGKRYGTTAVCALLIGNVLYVAHCGDSRAVLCRDGGAAPLTRDHKPASVPAERHRIEAQGGKIAYPEDRVHSNPEGARQSTLAMSRALGDVDHKVPRRLVEAEPDVARIVLLPQRDAFLVLGSDGLFDVLSVIQVVQVAQHALHGSTIGEAAATRAAGALVNKALAKGTTDNVTAAVMLFSW